MKPVRYVHALKADPRPKLFGFESPGPVRAWALRLLEDREESDFLLKHALRDAGRYQHRVEIEEGWRAEGHWGVDRLYMRARGEAAAADKALIDAIRNLALLHLHCRPGKGEESGGYLEATAEFILARSRQDGSLELDTPARKTDKAGHQSFRTSGHWAGVAIAALLNFGIQDSRIDSFFHRLETTQREDGGWLPARLHRRPTKENLELPSHPLYTTAFAWALSSSTSWRTSSAALRAAENLLRTALRTVRPYKAATERHWRRLAAPQWEFDALRALEIALDTGVDPRSDDVLRIARWLIKSQRSSGIWKAEPAWGKRPDEDLFVTLRAAVALKRLIDDHDVAEL